jgi:hypothetical protein
MWNMIFKLEVTGNCENVIYCIIAAVMHLPPPVPIKTYRWEDLRRARIRGGYPWTHLDKPSLDSYAWKDTRYVLTLKFSLRMTKEYEYGRVDV